MNDSQTKPGDVLLQNTIFEGAVTAKVDGILEIIKEQSRNFKINGIVCLKKGVNVPHRHWFNVINGEWLTDCAHCPHPYVRKVKSIRVVGSILETLTEEEMLKAMRNELTDEDKVTIIYRMKNKESRISKLIRRLPNGKSSKGLI